MVVRQLVKYVFSKIKDITEIKLNDQKKLKQILNPSTSRNPSKEPFYTLFMAMYELIILEKREPFDLDSFFEAIYDLSSKTKSGSHYVRSADRRKNINLCKGLIRDSFKESTAPIRSQGKLALDFENYLRLSKVESPCYDFKQGLYSLDKINRGMKKEMLDKYFSNIAALANLGKNKKGYMFIGVTDKEKDTKIIEEIDYLKGIPRFDKFGVVGLEREAKLKGISLDEYILLIAQKIRDSELPSWLKSKINTSMTPITYRGFTVLMLEIESGTQPVWYKNKLFIRDGASHKEVTGEETNSVYNLFN